MSTSEPLAKSDDQVVLITGMSRGLGEWLARAFWRAGFNVFGTARDAVALEAVVGGLAIAPMRVGQRVAIACADLRDATAPRAIVQQCMDQLGGCDVLVSNAAVQGPIGRFWEQDLAA